MDNMLPHLTNPRHQMQIFLPRLVFFRQRQFQDPQARVSPFERSLSTMETI